MILLESKIDLKKCKLLNYYYQMAFQCDMLIYTLLSNASTLDFFLCRDTQVRGCSLGIEYLVNLCSIISTTKKKDSHAFSYLSLVGCGCHEHVKAQSPQAWKCLFAYLSMAHFCPFS